MAEFDSPDGDQFESDGLADCRNSSALFVSDTEMLRRIGVSKKIGRIAIRELEKRLAFPPKDPLFGNKRYWPAVRAFLDARGGVTTLPPRAIYTPNDAEHFHYREQQREG
jgi:hypothetical protein